ncbi:MAG TPA: ABC transporter permease [Gaiellaceae bacterium]|nr:ABC transporter permease [Gaiellaceae bacterium]
MFYLRYVQHELLRRRARTILTALGLALGVALVIVISGLSNGLSHAQKTALNPLSSIGTDITVTRNANTTGGGFGPGSFGGQGEGELLQANSSVLTDLSKLGKPGTHFVHDFFLPGTQLTFPATQATRLKSLSGVSQVSTGLLLVAEHQSGTVPKIVAKFKTGGQTFNIRRRISPPTPAEQAQIQACLKKNGVTFGSPSSGGSRNGGGFGSGGSGSNGGGRHTFVGPGGGVFGKCLPKRFQQFRTRFTTPQQTFKQILDPPQTNIKTTPYTIGGVDQTQPDMALVTPSQVTKGSYFSRAGGREALVAGTYAASQKLKVGSKLDLNGTSFTVVGLVSPPLGGQSADVYLPLKQLQTLAHEKGLANVVLVRADKSSSVGSVKKEIQSSLGSGAQVATESDVAKNVTGSLVNASNLSHSLGLALEIVIAAAVFLLAALLTLSSVGKRVRELGTLKAVGWTQKLVVRQVVGETLAQGILGGIIGVALGVVAAVLFDEFGPRLTASSVSGGSGANLLGLGNATLRTAKDTIALHAPLSVELILLGIALAIGGGLIAGAAGGLRAGRLRPADALRKVE